MEFRTPASDAKTFAEQDLSSRNVFAIPPIPAAVRNMRSLKIFNIWGERFPVETGMGVFVIQPCEPGFVWNFTPHELAEYHAKSKMEYDTNVIVVMPEGVYRKQAAKPGQTAYSRPLFVPGMPKSGYAVDLRKIAFHDMDGRDLACDILSCNSTNPELPAPNKHPSLNLTAWGCFLAEGDVPTEEELKAAHVRLTKKMVELWKEGQAAYMQGPNHMTDISELHRKADVFLRRNAPWNQEAQQMEPCPACHRMLFEGTAACLVSQGGCGAVLDEKKVIQYRLKGYEDLWNKSPKPPRQQGAAQEG